MSDIKYCNRCKGTAYKFQVKTCAACAGSNPKNCKKCRGWGSFTQSKPCGSCNGTGRDIPRGKCVTTGVRTAGKTYDFENDTTFFETTDAFYKRRGLEVDWNEWDAVVWGLK